MHGCPHGGGGGGKSRRSPLPQEKNVFRYLVAFLLLSFHVGAFCTVFHLMGGGAFFTMWGPFCNFFCPCGEPFMGLHP